MGALEGKVAIVMGAGQSPGPGVGNGRAMALLFAREGARVLAVDRALEEAERSAALITDAGGEALALQADVTSRQDCERAAKTCRERFGRIDVLVNNVGTTGGRHDGDVSHVQDSAWDHIFDVNLKSVFHMCKQVVPTMREQGGGAIINISSLSGVSPMGGAASRTSKAGVNALSEQMAIANARHGIRVNVIMPGMVTTPRVATGYARVTGGDPDALQKMRSERIPLAGPPGDAWDIARAALFLASDASKFITGTAIPVDGGQHLRVG